VSRSKPLVSIVIATYQRADRVRRCIERTREGVDLPFELVVVDGGSTDGSAEWLREQDDIRLHVEQRRAGCCAAYDIGFRMARGELVMWLNDDAYPLPGAVQSAVDVLLNQRHDRLGMVAFYHNHHQPWNELHGIEHDGERYGVLHVRGLPYANFGLLRRALYEQVGGLDRAYHFCAWDPDLSLKVQREARLDLVGAPSALVYHEELVDARKKADAGEVRTRDNAHLFRKWRLPDKDAFPDPRPGYESLMRRYGLI
jgi:GT2 family glycosyltransferase